MDNLKICIGILLLCCTVLVLAQASSIEYQQAKEINHLNIKKQPPVNENNTKETSDTIKKATNQKKSSGLHNVFDVLVPANLKENSL